MNYKTIILIIILSTLFFSCEETSNEKEEFIFSSSPASGQIEGEEFEFTTGHAETDTNNTNLFITLYKTESINHDPCFEQYKVDKITFYTPKKQGTYDFDFINSNKNTATFYSCSNDSFRFEIANKGAVIVTSVDDSLKTISGKIVAEADDENFINGLFEVTICN